MPAGLCVGSASLAVGFDMATRPGCEHRRIDVAGGCGLMAADRFCSFCSPVSDVGSQPLADAKRFATTAERAPDSSRYLERSRCTPFMPRPLFTVLRWAHPIHNPTYRKSFAQWAVRNKLNEALRTGILDHEILASADGFPDGFLLDNINVGPVEKSLGTLLAPERLFDFHGSQSRGLQKCSIPYESPRKYLLAYVNALKTLSCLECPSGKPEHSSQRNYRDAIRRSPKTQPLEKRLQHARVLARRCFTVER